MLDSRDERSVRRTSLRQWQHTCSGPAARSFTEQANSLSKCPASAAPTAFPARPEKRDPTGWTALFGLLVTLVLTVGALTTDRSARAAQPGAPDSTGVVTGTVVDGEDAPLSRVNVRVQGTLDGDVTDDAGRYRFRTEKTGEPAVVEVSLLGFQTIRKEVLIAPGDTTRVDATLRPKVVQLDEAEVVSNAYTTGDVKGTATLSTLDVVTTPGAAGDIFRAVQTLPGVTKVDDGAGLFVRGGDVSETVVLLDQATVAHPYQYESPTGGFFGSIPPFLTDGTAFSTGGFSARYGNALSAVLAMESRDVPPGSSVEVNAGLASASVGAHLAPAGDDLGVHLSANRSFSDVLFRVNGRGDEYTRPPGGYDVNLGLTARYSDTGQVKAFSYLQNHTVGVRAGERSYEGVYSGREVSRMHNLQHSDVWNGWTLRSSLSLTAFDKDEQFGALDLRTEDRTYKWRFDAETPLGESAQLSLGHEVEHIENRFRGEVPQADGGLDPKGNAQAINDAFGYRRVGGYAEVDAQLGSAWQLRAGVRGDHLNLTQDVTVDPRLSVRYHLTGSSSLRLATGVYHQFAEPFRYNPTTGTPGLNPQQARHYILGFRHDADELLARVEGYYKTYDDLVVEGDARNYRNRGGGYARGVDVFLKSGRFATDRLSGWVSYSFLQSRRVQPRHRSTGVTYEEGPSPYDVTHRLTVVGKAKLTARLSAGATYTVATGRPVTPVEEGIPHDGGRYYTPVEGPVGGERLPRYERLDLNLSYRVPLVDGHDVYVYAAVNNALDRANVTGRTYDRSYSSYDQERTHFRRLYYVGLRASFHL